MDVVSILKSRAQRERELLFKPPDYKLVEEQAAEQIEQLSSLVENIKNWYYIHQSESNLSELAKILKL